MSILQFSNNEKIAHNLEDQRKLQSSASPAFVRGIYRGPVNSPQKASNAENVYILWRHHVLVNWITIASGIGSSTTRHQAVTDTNVLLLSF